MRAFLLKLLTSVSLICSASYVLAANNCQELLSEVNRAASNKLIQFVAFHELGLPMHPDALAKFLERTLKHKGGFNIFRVANQKDLGQAFDEKPTTELIRKACQELLELLRQIYSKDII
ncbi:MAG: hypothetical protein AAGB31_16245 [Bdellovibrio sp.]